MKGKMKAVVKQTSAPGAELVMVDIPSPGPGEVLVNVHSASICGTDHHIYIWNEWAQGRIKPPKIMGHEFYGEVVELGDGTESIKVGDLVSAETHVVCGRCPLCLTGKGHVCKNTTILGVDINGAFAEYVVIPEANAWINGKNIPPELASIQEPLGNAVHTVLSGDIAGRTVAVTGCGPIGLMAIAVAKAVGAAAVYATEINGYRAELAMKMGAERVFNPAREDAVKGILEATGGYGVDVVAEMSGNPKAISQAFDMVKQGGRISLLGLPAKPVELDISEKLIFKGVTVKGITGRLMYDTWFQVKGLLESGRMDLQPVITHRLPLEDFKKGMELMDSGDCGKVILYP
ncbi:MAG: L-threonine 3-dehydrogenase [Firmicutes bacterium]|nr:L-threonine 3-dehydrogenase [Bacillota bacterium]MDI6704931.1 L-threonine 3-dehydrogenase [Bacillota bacterium]